MPAVVLPAPGLPPSDQALARNSGNGRRQADTVPALDACARDKGGSCLTNELVEANLGFVFGIAGEYRNMGLPLEDLVNEGNIGLLEAARRFDPTRGTRFITYAVWWIRRSIRRALTKDSANVYVPEYRLKMVRRLRTTRSRLSGALGREADREELSRELGVKIAKIDTILQVKLREISIDEGVGPSRETALSDLLVDRSCLDPENDLISREARGLLRRALLHLTNQEQAVIINHFGLGGGPTFSLSEIGRHLSISRERVRQIKDKSQRRLRRLLESRPQPAWAARREAAVHPYRGSHRRVTYGPQEISHIGTGRASARPVPTENSVR